jgi:hypothetical protein
MAFSFIRAGRCITRRLDVVEREKLCRQAGPLVSTLTLDGLYTPRGCARLGSVDL